MCIALPMKVIRLDQETHTATVSAAGNQVQVNYSLIDPQIGDYVLVHAGCAIEIVAQESADEILELLDTLEELGRHDA